MIAMMNASQGQGGGPRVGVALSGGGFRAALFHLGTIRYLEEAGIMPRVEVISTVSGGSIIGAFYLVEMERKLRAKPGTNRLEACDEIIERFCELLSLNFRMRALVFYPFFHPVLALLTLLRLRHSGDTMAREFETHLFSPELRVGDLPVQILHDTAAQTLMGHASASSERRDALRIRGTRILINMTSLISGRRFVVSRESDTGIRAQIERSDPNNLSLARVVGASAAVPGVFKPLRIGNEVLADGGVVDNQGIDSLFDYFELGDEGLNRLPDAFRQPAALRDSASDRPIFLIVSDGAGQFSVKPVSSATRAASASRSMCILQAANRRKTLHLLLESYRSEQLGGFAFSHLALNIKGARANGDEVRERLPSELIGPTAELRTDLDDFSRLERDALIYHGYTLMKQRVRQYGRMLEPEDASSPRPGDAGSPPRCHFSWPPPFIDLCDPGHGHEARAREARLRIERFLRIGESAAFRDVRRCPWVFGPLLAFFLVVGRGLAHLLLTVRLTYLGPGWDVTVHQWIRDRLGDVIVGLVPQIKIPYLVNLTGIECAFRDPAMLCPGPKGEYWNGRFWGALDFTAAAICVALAFYLALWLYWEVKQRFKLPSRCEARMLSKVIEVPDESGWRGPPDA